MDHPPKLNLSLLAQKRPKKVVRGSTNETTHFVGVHKRSGRKQWTATFRRVYLGSSPDPEVCAKWYDQAVFAYMPGGQTNFPHPDPAYPLTQDVRNKLKLKTHQTNNNTKKCDDWLFTYPDGRYGVGVGKGVEEILGPIKTLDDAITTRDIASKQGTHSARKYIAKIYKQNTVD
jgi:hypothetical protein